MVVVDEGGVIVFLEEREKDRQRERESSPERVKGEKREATKRPLENDLMCFCRCYACEAQENCKYTSYACY